MIDDNYSELHVAREDLSKNCATSKWKLNRLYRTSQLLRSHLLRKP